MGLDITAYGNATPCVNAPTDENGYPTSDNQTLLSESLIQYTDTQFPGSAAGIKPGIYHSVDRVSFRAGSYGGYNFWRDHLSRMALGKSAEAVWTEPPEDAPFLELIDFSDCEGVIGPVRCAKLAKDFQDHREQAKAYAANMSAAGRDGQSWLALYELWSRAMLAGATGFLRFH